MKKWKRKGREREKEREKERERKMRKKEKKKGNIYNILSTFGFLEMPFFALRNRIPRIREIS